MSLDDTAFNQRFLPYEFTDAQLLAIGRVIRLCAELEEIVDVHLCNVAEISEGQMLILLGQTSAGRKAKIAETRAKAISPACIEAHRACFNHPEYVKVIRFRNAVAHGQLLGVTEKGEVALMVSEVTESALETVAIRVRAYRHELFDAYAKVAAELVREFDRVLRTKPLREKRRAQFRGRAPAPLGRRKPSAERRHPPEPSRE